VTVGVAVVNFKPGDPVLISCITSCGKCPNCKRQLCAHCSDGGRILGQLFNETQAQYVRIPHGDNSLYPIPEGADEDALVMLSDIMPMGLRSVCNGGAKPGDTMAISGVGPVGMSVLLTSQFYSPGRIVKVDMDPSRLALACEIRCDGHHPAGRRGSGSNWTISSRLMRYLAMPRARSR